MRIFSYMVTHNEASRYLRGTIDAVMAWADGLFVYDDRSTDETVGVVLDHGGVDFQVRPRREPSFMEDESAFRENAWRCMEEALKPEEGDWILTLDADEKLLYESRDDLLDACDLAEKTGYDSIRCRVHECWGVDGGPTNDHFWDSMRTGVLYSNMPVRMDGYWGHITAVRACQYKPGGSFKTAAMGGGSVPDYVQRICPDIVAFEIAHLGYLRQADREKKYARYKDRPGHNKTHIESILARPKLAKLGDVSMLFST